MKRIIICFVLIGFISNCSFAQSKINRAENSLKKESTSYSRSSDDNGSNNNSDNFFVVALAEVFVQGFLYVTYYSFIGGPNEFPNSHISKFPYYNSDKGNFNYDIDENLSRFRADLSSRYIFENNTLNGMHFTADLRFLRRIGFEADYTQLWEKSPNFGTDALALYSFVAKYHRIPSQKFDLWWGLGTTYVAGSVNEFGFTYGLGAELFFAKPLSLEANFNQTFINTETVNKLNFLLNYHKGRYKILGGYEHLKIGTQDFSMITCGLGLFL